MGHITTYPNWPEGLAGDTQMGLPLSEEKILLRF